MVDAIGLAVVSLVGEEADVPIRLDRYANVHSYTTTAFIRR